MRTCDIDGCDHKHVARGLCNIHYGHLRRGSTPADASRQQILDARIEDAEWMAETGETVPGAAERLGLTVKQLRESLRGQGRLDLTARLERNSTYLIGA